MNIQSTIILLIEVIFWAFVAIMMNDFVNGLFELWHNQTLTPVSAITPQLDPITQQIAVNEPQFELIPDPWELPVETKNNTSETQSIALPFPTLILLPPAKEVQTKRKRTTNKSTTNERKSTKGKSSQKTSRSRKKAA